MRVFISWSKPTSQRVALALRDWLREVIQQIDPWVSSEDILKGQRWSAEVGNQLDSTSQGIVCVTAGNSREPWLNFEAGALAKSLSESRVRPVLLGIRPSDVTGPLSQFQATIATDREDMLRLVQSLNKGCEPPLDEGRLTRAFDKNWLDLEASLQQILREESSDAEPEPARPTDEVLAEVLDVVRTLQRRDAYRRTATLALPDGRVLEPGVPVQHPTHGSGTVTGTVFRTTFDGTEAALTIRFDDGRMFNVAPGEVIPLLNLGSAIPPRP
jgi:hypothetical protein